MNNSYKANILLVEDEENLHETLKLNLQLEGYSVTSAYDGLQALKAVANEFFNLIVLDIMLPEMDGISVLESIKLKYPDVPVLILSAKNTSADKVLGLKKGADDYLTKPFHLQELLLRTEKLIEKGKRLQHIAATQNTEVTFAGNTIHFKAQEAINWKGKHIALSKKETLLLKLLIENKNQVVSREKILQTVWNYQVYPTTRTIDNFILNFRKYFEKEPKNPQHFLSVRGTGYKFSE
jgi:two-component system alkaline phosphatase synthesis response regulator PhoP